MEQDNPKLQEFHKSLVDSNYGVPDYNTFAETLRDPAKSKTFYDALVADKYEMPDYDTFVNTLGLKKKDLYETLGFGRDLVKEVFGEDYVKPSPKEEPEVSKKPSPSELANFKFNEPRDVVGHALDTMPAPEETDFSKFIKPDTSLKTPDSSGYPQTTVDDVLAKGLLKSPEVKEEDPSFQAYLTALPQGFNQRMGEAIRNMGAILNMPKEAIKSGVEKIGGKNASANQEFINQAFSQLPLIGTLSQENLNELAGAIEKAGNPEAIPNDLVGKTLGATGSILFDIATIRATPTSKINALAKYGMERVPMFPTYLGLMGGATSAREGKGLGKTALATTEGVASGLTYEGMGVAAGRVGQLVRELGGGQALSSSTKALANSVMFGADSKIKGGSFAEGAAMGLVFGGYDIGAEAIHRSIAHRSYISYLTTTDNAIKTISKMQVDPMKLRKQSDELWNEYEKETNPEFKKKLLDEKTSIDNIISVNAMTQEIVKNPKAFIDNIQKDQRLSAKEKKLWTDKISTTVKEADPRIAEAELIVADIRKKESELQYWQEDTSTDQKIKDAKIQSLNTQIEEQNKALETTLSKPLEDYAPKKEKKSEKAPEEVKVQTPEEIAKENNLEYQGQQKDESGTPVLDLYKRKDNQANLSVPAGSDATVVKAEMEAKKDAKEPNIEEIQKVIDSKKEKTEDVVPEVVKDETAQAVTKKLDKQSAIKEDKIFKEQKNQLLDDLISAEDILFGTNKEKIREEESKLKEDSGMDQKQIDDYVTQFYEHKLDALPKEVETKLNKLGIKVRDGKLIVDVYKDGTVEVGDIRTALRIIDKGFPARLKETRYTTGPGKPGKNEMRMKAESYGSLKESERRLSLAEENLATAKKSGNKGLTKVMEDQLAEVKAIHEYAKDVDYTRLEKEAKMNNDKEFGAFWEKNRGQYDFDNTGREQLYNLLEKEGRPKELTYESVQPIVLKAKLEKEGKTVKEKIAESNSKLHDLELELSEKFSRKDGKGLKSPKTRSETFTLNSLQNQIRIIEHQVADLKKYESEINKLQSESKTKEEPSRQFKHPTSDEIKQMVEDKTLPKAFYGMGDIEILAIRKGEGIEPRTGEVTQRKTIYYIRKEAGQWEVVKDLFDGENRVDRVILGRDYQKDKLSLPNDGDFYLAQQKFGDALKTSLEKDAEAEFEKEAFILRNKLTEVQKLANEDYDVELKKAKLYKLAKESQAPQDKIDEIQKRVKEKWIDRVEKAKQELKDFKDKKDEYIKNKLNEKPNEGDITIGKEEGNIVSGGTETGAKPVETEGEAKPANTIEVEKKAIERWLKDEGEKFISVDWDGEIVEIFRSRDRAVEEYTREELIEKGVEFPREKPVAAKVEPKVEAPIKEELSRDEILTEIIRAKDLNPNKVGYWEERLREFDAKTEPAKELPTTKDGVTFKDKTYTSVDEVLDAIDRGEITFEESKQLREDVNRFEEGLRDEAKKVSDDISSRVDKGMKDVDDQIKKDIIDENSKLSVKMFPDLISRGNTVLWKQLVKVRDGLANTIAGQLKKGVISQNDAIRWTTKTITNLYNGLLRTEADMFGTGKDKQIGKMEMMGTVRAYAPHKAFDLLTEWRNVVNADPEALRNVWSVLDPELATKAGDRPKVYGDLSVAEKKLYFMLKEWNTWVWSTNYANGLIPTESHLKFKGDFDATGYSDYIARMYDAYEEGTILSPEIQEFISRGNSAVTSRLNTDYMKLREETNGWKQEHAITDPAYLTAKRVMQTIQNTAVKQYMDMVIDQHPEYVLKLKKGEEVPKGFTKLGASYSWGPLRNRAVANHIVEDFTGFYYQNAITNTAYDLVKMVDRSKLNQFYKKYRTVYNPFVQTGNVTGNVFFASINGINPFSFVKGMIDNRNLHQTNPALYDNLLKSGLIGDTAITGEMKPADLLDPKKTGLGKADELATKAYVGADNLAKISAYQIFRRQGLSHEQAVRRAYDSFQNYATVGKTWDIASKIPLVGPTFGKFQADLQRILVNNMLTTPLTTIGTIMMIKMLGNLSSALSGETEEEQELREGRKGVPRIPFVNIPLSFKVGKSELNVARYLSPLYLYNRGDSEMELSELSKFMPIQFQKKEEGKMFPLPAFADATWGWLGSVATDRDFRGISISDPKLTKYTDPNTPTDEKVFNIMNYIARSQIPFYKGTADIINGATGQLDYYGRKRTWEQAILNNIIKIQQFDKPELKNYVERNLDYLTSKYASLATKMGDAQGVFYKTLMRAEEQELSPEAQQKVYEAASKLRDKSIAKSLKEQIPVYQEIEHLTNVYKKWNPEDPFIKENYQNIESGKVQRFNVLNDVDLQKKYPTEYALLKKNEMLKKPEIPKFYRGVALTDDEKKEYSNVYWSEYIRILDSRDLLSQEEMDEMKGRIARREIADTMEGIKEVTRLQDFATEAASRARMVAERNFRKTK